MKRLIVYLMLLLFCLLFLFFVGLGVSKCFAEEINIEKIVSIESSGNFLAHKKSTGARGLMGITPICLKDWNQNNKKQHGLTDLFYSSVNKKIGTWYINEKIPKYLANYGLENTVENRLMAYDWGAKNLRDYKLGLKKLPIETKEYVIKYRRMK